MTTPNVLTQALQMMSSSGGEIGLSKLQTGTGTGFGQVMSDSLKNQQGSFPNGAEAIKQSSSPGKQFASKPVADKKEALPVTKGSISEENAGPSEITSETAAAVEGEIKDLVKEELGLTDEELEEAMAVLGLEYLDLLLPENMKALVLEVNQADAVELLTNEDLNSQLTKLLQGVEEVLSEAGLEPSMEELPGLLEELKAAEAEPEDTGIMTEAVEADKDQPKVEILVEKAVSKEPEKAKEEDVQEPEENTAKTTEGSAEKTEESTGKEETKNEFQSTGRRQDSREDFQSEPNQSPMETIIQNLSNHVSPDEAAVTAAQRLEVMREIVNQVLDQIRISIKPDTTSMEITLNPENLGKISLTVVSREGHLTASFTAQNQVTKEALESQVQTLKENLTSQGIKVDAIEVNIESFAFDERNQMNGGQGNNGQSKPKERRLSAEDIARAFGEEPDSEEEILDTAAITQSGSNVDYTA